MASINKAILIGNLGRDPDLRYTSSGTAVCTFSIATTEKWKDKQSNEKKEETSWHNIVLWGRMAEVAKEYLQKGSSVYIEGKIRTRKYQDKDGKDRWITEIIGQRQQFLSSAQDSSSTKSTKKTEAPPPPEHIPEEDDDLPF